ncbi:MAG: hypothetical protein AAF542_14100 [Pseudomonadota bacterium]
MNILIMGRAKTGTTVISKTIENSLPGTSNYCLEPKNIGYFYDQQNFPTSENHIVKIIFEHWNSTPRCRNGLLHNESPVKFDRVVNIVRDPRDEHISRLLYIIKPWVDANGFDLGKTRQWLDALEQKETNPGSYSFLDMVLIFDDLFETRMFNQIMHPIEHSNYLEVLKVNQAQSFVIRYEDFMKGDLDHLQQYLGFQIGDDRDVGNLSRTLRTAAYDNWKTYFTEHDIQQLRPLYEPVLQRMGYEDWNLQDDPKVLCESNSGYVKRLVGLDQT